MILALIITFLSCVLNAEWDAYKIRRNRNVNHWMNLFMALSLAVFWMLVYNPIVGVTQLFLIPLVFDQWLNVRRGLPFTYQPLKPDSFIDKQENKLFGHKNAWAVSNLIYLAGVVVGVWWVVK